MVFSLRPDTHTHTSLRMDWVATLYCVLRTSYIHEVRFHISQRSFQPQDIGATRILSISLLEYHTCRVACKGRQSHLQLVQPSCELKNLPGMRPWRLSSQLCRSRYGRRGQEPLHRRGDRADQAGSLCRVTLAPTLLTSSSHATRSRLRWTASACSATRRTGWFVPPSSASSSLLVRPSPCSCTSPRMRSPR